LYVSPSIINGDHIKEDEVGRALACMGERRNDTKFWSENLKENLSIDGRIIIDCILRQEGGNLCTGFI